MILKRISILNYKNLSSGIGVLAEDELFYRTKRYGGRQICWMRVDYLSFCKSATNPIDSQNIRHEGEFFVIQGFLEQTKVSRKRYIVD